uniref:PIN domain-containing protein n=1 Tax=Candidatus Kentrum sp. LFY TaxID=2126342 RepID=A0A450V1I0_9GAMM|nr:MAG: PIN domain-containing protein [Candidatus Kentron sp. LFY]
MARIIGIPAAPNDGLTHLLASGAGYLGRRKIHRCQLAPYSERNTRLANGRGRSQLILYCDTSALLELYIQGTHSDLIETQIDEADAVAVCRIAWAEAHAALARRAREVPEDRLVIETAKTTLRSDWPRYVVLEISQTVVERAGEYADIFALRGYDSVQLATAFEIRRLSRATIHFACFDVRLNKAARVLGMQTIP